jgi:AmmeMemoRadiSam system protein B
MNVRKRSLPGGWYPDSPDKIREFLEKANASWKRGGACAAIAPHAGWYFSGALAAQSVYSLAQDAETIAVFGGHLPQGYPPLYWEEDMAETPLGLIELDAELRSAMEQALPGRPDRYADNTVEVQIPMIKYFFPDARLLAMRLPADSIGAGRALAEAATGRRVAVLASTDLTHYGENYGFAPRGFGPEALDWVRTKNDAAFIEAVLSGDAGEILRRAEEDRSACSPGAAVAALEFALAQGGVRPELLAYTTSADVLSERPSGRPDFSAVGYGAIAWYGANAVIL